MAHNNIKCLNSIEWDLAGSSFKEFSADTLTAMDKLLEDDKSTVGGLEAVLTADSTALAKILDSECVFMSSCVLWTSFLQPTSGYQGCPREGFGR